MSLVRPAWFSRYYGNPAIAVGFDGKFQVQNMLQIIVLCGKCRLDMLTGLNKSRKTGMKIDFIIYKQGTSSPTLQFYTNYR